MFATLNSFLKIFLTVSTAAVAARGRDSDSEWRTLSLPDAQWIINNQCDAVCYAPPLLFWKCAKLRNIVDICKDINFQHSHKCCDAFTTTTSTTRPSTTTTSGTSTTMSTTPSSSTTSTTPVTSTIAPSSTTPKPTSHCGNMAPEMCEPEPGCAYHCPDDGTCKVNRELRANCFLGCSSFCQNPCGCRSHANGACEYNVVTGVCQHREYECSSKLFPDFECGRKNGFYVDAGVVCKNTKQRGNCSISHNVLAVNIYADTQHIDKRGIAYQPDHSGFYKDPYNIRGKFDVRRDLHIVDKDLYALGVMGRAKGSEITQCITYGIGIRETGRYELALRLFEPTVNKHAKRLFNIELHELLVLAELDIFSLVGKSKPLDLLINFRVSKDLSGRRIIDIKGHPSKSFPGILKLSICIGKCRFCPGYSNKVGNAVLSGFSVIRLEST